MDFSRFLKENYFIPFFFFFYFLGPHSWHMEVPRLGVDLELQLPAHTTVTAMEGLCHVCNLHHSLGQPQILDPLSEARDQNPILRDTSRVFFRCPTVGTPACLFLKTHIEE